MKSVPVYIFTLIGVFIFARTVYAQPQPLTLERAKALVLEAPRLLSQQARARALSLQPDQEGSLPDPVLSFGALSFPVDTWKRGQENMTQLQVGISQALPFPGKLGLKADAARFRALAGEAQTRELRLDLLSRVQMRWWNLFYLDRALGIVDKNKTLLRQLIRVAQTKYKTGKGLQQDVLLAQLELSRLLDSEMQWHAMRAREQAKLNALLNRPATQAVVLPAEVDESLRRLPDEEVLLRMARTQRPLLDQKQRLMDASQAEADLAEKDFYPDFTLSARYGARSANSNTGVNRADLASLTLSLNIPFGDTQDAYLAQKQAEKISADFDFEDALAQVQAEVGVALAAYRQARSQVLLFRQGIIPQAEQTVASMMAAYQVNKVDFLNLVRAQITLYSYETQYWKVLAQARQSLARLTAAVGQESALPLSNTEPTNE